MMPSLSVGGWLGKKWLLCSSCVLSLLGNWDPGRESVSSRRSNWVWRMEEMYANARGRFALLFRSVDVDCVEVKSAGGLMVDDL